MRIGLTDLTVAKQIDEFADAADIAQQVEHGDAATQAHRVDRQDKVEHAGQLPYSPVRTTRRPVTTPSWTAMQTIDS